MIQSSTYSRNNRSDLNNYLRSSRHIYIYYLLIKQDAFL